VADRPDLDSDADALVTGAYRAILGRPPEPEGLTSAVAALRRGAIGRFEFVRNLVASPEFAELVTMEELTRAACAAGRPFDPDGPVGSAGSSERITEVPWVLSRYRGERRVLDVGYANAPAAYLALLSGLGIAELHCVDLAARPIGGAHASRADVRRLPYADASFELVLCVSTLEHIGLDNTRYTPLREAVPGDHDALVELSRVLVSGGRLLVTVPIGHRENHRWFHQYDVSEWEELVGRSAFATEEQTAFRVSSRGWEREHDISALGELRYGTGGPGAAGVLCASLVRRGAPAH
jgi:SAM-dependent methyltransferase